MNWNQINLYEISNLSSMIYCNSSIKGGNELKYLDKILKVLYPIYESSRVLYQVCSLILNSFRKQFYI